MKYLKMFFHRVVNDLKQKELLPLKLLFFINSSTILVLYPYLTIHMRELGINVQETAIMSAIIPLIAIIVPPAAGMFADKIGNFKILLALFSALGGLASLLLLIVPVGRMTVKYPESVIMDLSCGDHNPYLSVYETDFVCESRETHLYGFINVHLESCGLLCPSLSLNPTDRHDLNYTTVQVYNNDNVILGTYQVSLSKSRSARYSLIESLKHRNLKNTHNFNDSVRLISNMLVFIPIKDYTFNCNSSNGNQESTCQFNYLSDLLNEDVYRVHIDTILEKNNTDFNKLKMFSVQSLKSIDVFKTINDLKESPSCSNNIPPNLEVWISTENKNKSHRLNDCTPQCLVSANRSEVCANKEGLVEFDISLTFWTYFAVRVFIGVISGTSFAMFEGAVIAILREQNADYGLQRIYATIGGMISSPLGGLLIDYYSDGKDYIDFRPAFFLYAILKITSAVLMLTINLEFKTPAKNVFGDVINILKNIEVVALFIACFILGTAWGYIESFLFWLLQDLGGSRSLMGITITVGGIAGIPLLVMSGPIIKRLGHANVIFMGFIFYAIRLLGYSFIYDPWLCLIFEAMESITSSLAFTAAVTYAAKLSTITTDSSIQGMLGGLYFGVGKGSGSLIGGFLIQGVGMRETYRIFALTVFVSGLIYFFFNMFYLRKRTQLMEVKTDKDVYDVEKPNKIEDLNKIQYHNNDTETDGNINMAYDNNESIQSSKIKI